MEYQIHTNTHIENHSSETSSNGINERVTYMTWGFLFSIPILICCDAATALSLAFFFFASSLRFCQYCDIPYHIDEQKKNAKPSPNDTLTQTHSHTLCYIDIAHPFVVILLITILIYMYDITRIGRSRGGAEKKTMMEKEKKRLWSQYTAAQKAHRVQVVASHLTNISNQM